MSAVETNKNKPKVRHFKWSPAEDMLLKKLILSKAVPNWTLIARKFKNRNVRQCKDRWNYYLCPTVNNSEWTKEEDELLLEKYKEFGTKWSRIAKFFNNRTNTNVKNRYLAMMRMKEKEKMLDQEEEKQQQQPQVDASVGFNAEYDDSFIMTSPSYSLSGYEYSPEEPKQESGDDEANDLLQFDFFQDELSFDDDLSAIVQPYDI